MKSRKATVSVSGGGSPAKGKSSGKRSKQKNTKPKAKHTRESGLVPSPGSQAKTPGDGLADSTTGSAASRTRGQGTPSGGRGANQQSPDGGRATNDPVAGGAAGSGKSKSSRTRRRRAAGSGDDGSESGGGSTENTEGDQIVFDEGVPPLAPFTVRLDSLPLWCVQRLPGYSEAYLAYSRLCGSVTWASSQRAVNGRKLVLMGRFGDGVPLHTTMEDRRSYVVRGVTQPVPAHLEVVPVSFEICEVGGLTGYGRLSQAVMGAGIMGVLAPAILSFGRWWSGMMVPFDRRSVGISSWELNWPLGTLFLGASAWISSWIGGPRVQIPRNTRGSIGRTVWASAAGAPGRAVNSSMVVSRTLCALGHQRLAASFPAPNTEAALSMVPRVSEANVAWYMEGVWDTTIMYTLAAHSARTDGGMHYSYRAEVDDGASSITGSDAMWAPSRVDQGSSASS
jgi:hypothetical protein